jgi:DNA repair protein RadC
MTRSFRASRPEQIKDDIMTTLYVRSGSEFREATGEEIITRAQAFISQRFRRGTRPLAHPNLTAAFLQLHFGVLDYETFGMLHLDSRYRLITAESLFRGTIDHATVIPREIAQSALSNRTSNVILYHNHPSGVAEPSPADEAITQKIKQVLALLDIKVLDHLIVGETVFSLSKAGMI